MTQKAQRPTTSDRYIPIWDDPNEAIYQAVSIDLDVCDGCKLCTVICPANVLELYGPKTDLKVRLKDSASGCMSCNNCYAICAGKAIVAHEPYDFVGYYRQQRIGSFAYPRRF